MRCPRCETDGLGAERFCPACGLDLRPGTGTPNYNQAVQAREVEERWLAAHGGHPQPPPPPPPQGAFVEAGTAEIVDILRRVERDVHVARSYLGLMVFFFIVLPIIAVVLIALDASGNL